MTAGHIYAVEHIRKMRGGSQAHLLRASDNQHYVTKFRNNPQAVKILANEYLASKLGAHLGLPMPEVEIISVSDEFIANSADLRIDFGGHFVPCASGLQFGARYIADPLEANLFDYLPDSLLDQVNNKKDFPRILAFDKWTGNADGRQAVFSRPAYEGNYSATFIDQGYCFNAGEWNFIDSPFRGVYAKSQVYGHVRGWEDFEPTLSRIEQIDASEIWDIAREIPEEWYQCHTEGLARLIASLQLHRFLVRNLITDFRKSCRNPFPNWTDETSRPRISPQNKTKEEVPKVTDSKLKAVFVLNPETQSFKPTAHNLGTDLAMEQFSADPNARIVDQSERHRNADASKCRACRKEAQELTTKHAETAASGQEKEPAAQESEE